MQFCWSDFSWSRNSTRIFYHSKSRFFVEHPNVYFCFIGSTIIWIFFLSLKVSKTGLQDKITFSLNSIYRNQNYMATRKIYQRSSLPFEEKNFNFIFSCLFSSWKNPFGFSFLVSATSPTGFSTQRFFFIAKKKKYSNSGEQKKNGIPLSQFFLPILDVQMFEDKHTKLRTQRCVYVCIRAYLFPRYYGKLRRSCLQRFTDLRAAELLPRVPINEIFIKCFFYKFQ